MHWLQFDLSFCLISNILQAYSDFFWANSSFHKYELECGLFKNFLQYSWNGAPLANLDTFNENLDKEWVVCPGHNSITILLYGTSLTLVNLFSITYRKTSFCHSTFWGRLRVSDLRTGTIVVFQRLWHECLLLPISDEIRSKSFTFEDSRKTILSILSGFSWENKGTTTV